MYTHATAKFDLLDRCEHLKVVKHFTVLNFYSHQTVLCTITTFIAIYTHMYIAQATICTEMIKIR